VPRFKSGPESPRLDHRAAPFAVGGGLGGRGVRLRCVAVVEVGSRSAHRPRRARG
jgi:hypothetical protein